MREYSILSWNVDGYDAKVHAELTDYIHTHNPDIIFLSETKNREPRLAVLLEQIQGYSFIINAHRPSNTHGVAMLTKAGISAIHKPVTLNTPARHDTLTGLNDETAVSSFKSIIRGGLSPLITGNPADGRVIGIDIDNAFTIVGTYVPNSGAIGNAVNMDYRISKWDPALQEYLLMRTTKPTLWIGDINVAPTILDASDPETMCAYAGFRPAECESHNRFMSRGWIDVWRRDHPDARGYSWIGYGSRDNHGLRLDNIIASPDLAGLVTNTFIGEPCALSDHCPIGCTITI